MKPRTRKILATVLAGACALAVLTPAPGAPSDRKKKKGDAASQSPDPNGQKEKAKGGGSIPLPFTPGRSAMNVRIPDLDLTGKLLSLLMAEKATRLDDDRVKFEGMNMDFNKPDGKEDFHVVMPASVLNLKTHIIASDDPVKVSTQDFELTGEKMEFNTVERQGQLTGHVRMVIHNLKQLAGTSEPKSSE